MVDLADPGPTPEASAAAPDDRRRIEGCLGAAAAGPGARRCGPPTSRDYSYDELARRFDVPLNTMRTWLRRALIALRKCLES